MSLYVLFGVLVSPVSPSLERSGVAVKNACPGFGLETYSSPSGVAAGREVFLLIFSCTPSLFYFRRHARYLGCQCMSACACARALTPIPWSEEILRSIAAKRSWLKYSQSAIRASSSRTPPLSFLPLSPSQGYLHIWLYLLAGDV